MLCSSTKFVGTKYQNLANIEVNVGGILQEVYSSNNSFADLLSFARRFFFIFCKTYHISVVLLYNVTHVYFNINLYEVHM